VAAGLAVASAPFVPAGVPVLIAAVVAVVAGLRPPVRPDTSGDGVGSVGDLAPDGSTAGPGPGREPEERA
jgi:hypothetical protein